MLRVLDFCRDRAEWADKEIVMREDDVEGLFRPWRDVGPIDFGCLAVGMMFAY